MTENLGNRKSRPTSKSGDKSACVDGITMNENSGDIRGLPPAWTSLTDDCDDYTTRALLGDCADDWTLNTWPDLDTLMTVEPQVQSDISTDASPLNSPGSTAVLGDVPSPATGSNKTSPDCVWLNDDLGDLPLDQILNLPDSEDSAVSLSRSSSSSGTSSAQDDNFSRWLCGTSDGVFSEDRFSGMPQSYVSSPLANTASSSLPRQQCKEVVSGASLDQKQQRQLLAQHPSTTVSYTHGLKTSPPQRPTDAIVLGPTVVASPAPVAFFQAPSIGSAVPVNCSQASLISTGNSQQILVVTATSSMGDPCSGGSRRMDVPTHASRRVSLTGAEKSNSRPVPYMLIRPKQRRDKTSLCVAPTWTNYGTVVAAPPVQLVASEPAPTPTPDLAVDEKLSIEEVAALKRRSRMLRNREAACVSRQRKKEFVQSLQDRLNEVVVENDKLKRENAMLRNVVASLQAENKKLKGSADGIAKGSSSSSLEGARLSWTTGTKAAVCVFALLFLCSINVGSYWSTFYPRQLQPIAVSQLDTMTGQVETANFLPGRRLLSVSEEVLEENNRHRQDRNSTSKERRNITNETLGTERHNASSTPSCLFHFNRTESLMLAERLNSWARQHESERTSRYKLKRPSLDTDTRLWNEADEAEIAAFWGGERNRDLDHRQSGGGLASKGVPLNDLPRFPGTAGRLQYDEPYSAARKARVELKGSAGSGDYTDTEEKALEKRKLNSKRWSLQIYEGTELKYVKFLEALHRRDDTFYVISFLPDYLLLPANSYNKTARPRMSLVMPALPINESMQPPPHHVAMMQIECEVTGTSLLHLPEALIPSYLLHNGTSSYDSKAGSSKSQRERRSTKKTSSEKQKPNQRPQ